MIIVLKLTNSDVQEAEVDDSSDVVVEPAKTIPVHDRSVIFHIRQYKRQIDGINPFAFKAVT